jgi:hypothetical protein
MANCPECGKALKKKRVRQALVLAQYLSHEK